MAETRQIKEGALISELRAGPLYFIALKENDNISFKFEYDNKLLAEMGQEAAKFFCSCVTDVFKREGIK